MSVSHRDGCMPLVSLLQSAYEHHKEVKAAQGCKIIAKDLDKALAGLSLFVAHSEAEAEVYKVRLLPLCSLRLFPVFQISVVWSVL